MPQVSNMSEHSRRQTPAAQTSKKHINYHPSNQPAKQINSQVNANQPPVNLQPSNFANKQMNADQPPVNSNYAPPSFNTQSPAAASSSLAHSQHVSIAQPSPMTTQNIARPSQVTAGQSLACSQRLNFTRAATSSQPSTYPQPAQNNVVQSTSYPQPVLSNVGHVNTQPSFSSQLSAANSAQASVAHSPTYSHAQSCGQMSVAPPSTVSQTPQSGSFSQTPQPSSSQSF